MDQTVEAYLLEAELAGWVEGAESDLSAANLQLSLEKLLQQLNSTYQ